MSACLPGEGALAGRGLRPSSVPCFGGAFSGLRHSWGALGGNTGDNANGRILVSRSIREIAGGRGQGVEVPWGLWVWA